MNKYFIIIFVSVGKNSRKCFIGHCRKTSGFHWTILNCIMKLFLVTLVLCLIFVSSTPVACNSGSGNMGSTLDVQCLPPVGHFCIACDEKFVKLDGFGGNPALSNLVCYIAHGKNSNSLDISTYSCPCSALMFFSFFFKIFRAALSSQPTQQQLLDDAVKSLKCAKKEVSTCRGRHCLVKESMRSTKGKILEAEYLETKAQQLEEYAESLENIL
jgi:hypothetical protein